MSDTTTPQETVITLDNRNTALILLQYVEVAQKAGVFLLSESDLLKRCKDFLLTGTQDAEITTTKLARQLLVQAVNKGQSKGAYSLDEAALLHKVCTFVLANLETDLHTLPPVQQAHVEQPVQVPVEQPVSDLSELHAPVPLRSPRVL
jgi:hypothetical protein